MVQGPDQPRKKADDGPQRLEMAVKWAHPPSPDPPVRLTETSETDSMERERKKERGVPDVEKKRKGKGKGKENTRGRGRRRRGEEEGGDPLLAAAAPSPPPSRRRLGSRVASRGVVDWWWWLGPGVAGGGGHDDRSCRSAAAVAGRSAGRDTWEGSPPPASRGIAYYFFPGEMNLWLRQMVAKMRRSVIDSVLLEEPLTLGFHQAYPIQCPWSPHLSIQLTHLTFVLIVFDPQLRKVIANTKDFLAAMLLGRL
uniref:Uncharacterized protein n=1 Tax=Leersia perrieri TaxID=77586 RepID=A0A0D9VQ67_9ORYZ